MNELLTIDEMYEADRLAMESGISGSTLMENAGTCIGNEIVKRWPDARCVAVFCGPGNNGGDGFVIASFLKRHGYDVRVGLLGRVAKLKGDAAEMAAQWDGEILRPNQIFIKEADLIVDALFGAGLTRALDGESAEIVSKFGDIGVPVVAVDLPSGVDGQTGKALG